MSKVFQQREVEATPIVFHNLTELHIYMENYSCRTLGDLRYILEGCPRLETLHIDVSFLINLTKRMSEFLIIKYNEYSLRF